MTVASFKPTSYATQSGTAYPVQIDADLAVAARIVDNFAPRAADTPNMRVLVDPGHLFNSASSTLTELGIQTSATITAPSSLPRIDRIVADLTTGIIAVITGTENASPSPPPIPSGKFPIAQVALQSSTSVISNSLITDERVVGGSSGGGGFQTQVSIASAATTDIGSTNSNNVFVSGSTTITSLGSSASTTTPIYIVTFGNALTLVNSAHLILPGGNNIATAANDSMLVNYSGGGNWQVYGYFSASGNAKMNASNTGALTVSGALTGGTLMWAGNTVGTNAIGARTISASGPSGGADGDLWLSTGS